MTMGDSKIAGELAEDLNGLLDHFVDTQEEQGKASVAVQDLQSEQDNLKGQLEVRNAATVELEQDLQDLEQQLEKKEEEKLLVTGNLTKAEENLKGLQAKVPAPVSPEDQDKNANNGVQEGEVGENKKSRDVTREARPSSRRASAGEGSLKAAAAAAAAVPADSKSRSRRQSGLTNSSDSHQQAAVVSEDDNTPREPNVRSTSDSTKIPSKSRRSSTTGLNRQNSLDSGKAKSQSKSTRRISTSSRDDDKKQLLGSKTKDSVSKRRVEEGEDNAIPKESVSRRRSVEGEGSERRSTRSRPVSTQSARFSKTETTEVEAPGSSTSAVKKKQTMDPSNHSSTTANSELSGNDLAGDDDIDDEDDLDATLADVALRFAGGPSESVRDVPDSVNSDTKGSGLRDSSRSARTTGTRPSRRTSTEKPLSSGRQSSSRKLQTKANTSETKASTAKPKPLAREQSERLRKTSPIDEDSEKTTESADAPAGTPKSTTGSASTEKMSRKNLSSTSHRSSSRKGKPEILRANSFTSGSKSRSSEKLASLLMPPSSDNEEEDLEPLAERTPKTDTSGKPRTTKNSKTSSTNKQRSSPKEGRPEILRSNSFTSGSKSESSEKLAPLLMPTSSDDEDAALEQLHENTNMQEGGLELKSRPISPKNDAIGEPSSSKSDASGEPSSPKDDASGEPSSPKDDTSSEPKIMASSNSPSLSAHAQTSPVKSPLSTSEHGSSPRKDGPEILRSNSFTSGSKSDSSEKPAPLVLPTSSDERESALEEQHESTNKLEGSTEVEMCPSSPKDDTSGEPKIMASPKSPSSPSPAQTSPTKSPLSTSDHGSSPKEDGPEILRSNSLTSGSNSESSEKLAPLPMPISSNEKDAALGEQDESTNKLEGSTEVEVCPTSPKDDTGGKPKITATPKSSTSPSPAQTSPKKSPASTSDLFSSSRTNKSGVGRASSFTSGPKLESSEKLATPLMPISADDKDTDVEHVQKGVHKVESGVDLGSCLHSPNEGGSSERTGIEDSVVPNGGSFSEVEEEDNDLEKRGENELQMEINEPAISNDDRGTEDATPKIPKVGSRSELRVIEDSTVSLPDDDEEEDQSLEEQRVIEEPVTLNDDSGSEAEAEEIESEADEVASQPPFAASNDEVEEIESGSDEVASQPVFVASNDEAEEIESEVDEVASQPSFAASNDEAEEIESDADEVASQPSIVASNDEAEEIESDADEVASQPSIVASNDEAEEIESESDEVASQPPFVASNDGNEEDHLKEVERTDSAKGVTIRNDVAKEERRKETAPVFEEDDPPVVARSKSTGKRNTRRASLTNFMGNQARPSRMEDESCAFDPGPAQLPNFVPNRFEDEPEDDSSQYDSGTESVKLKNDMHQPISTQSDEESSSYDSGTAVLEQGKSEMLQVERTQNVDPSNHASTIASELGELSGDEFAGDDDDEEDEHDLDATLADVALQLEGGPTESAKDAPASVNKDAKLRRSSSNAKSAHPSRRRSTQKPIPSSSRHRSSRRVKIEADPPEKVNSSTKTKGKRAAGDRSMNLKRTSPIEETLTEPEKFEKPDLANMWRKIYNPNADLSRQKNDSSLNAGAKGATRHVNKNSAFFHEDLVLPALFPSEDDSDGEDENANRSSLFDIDHSSEEGNSSDDSGESSAESDHEEPGELIPQINFDGSVLQREVVQPNEGLAHLKTPYKRKDKLKAPKTRLSKTNHPVRPSRHTHTRKTGRHPAIRDALANSTWHGTTTSAKLSEGEEDDDKTAPKYVYQMSLDGSVSKKELMKATRRGELSRIKNPEEIERPAKPVVKAETLEDPVETNTGSAQFLAPKFDALGKSAHAAMKLKWSRRSRTKDHGELPEEPKAGVDETTDFDALAKMKWARRSRNQELSEEPQASVDEGLSAETKAEALAKSAATAMKWSDRSRLISNPAELFAGPQASADDVQVESKAKPEFKGKGNPEYDVLSKSITNAMKWKRRSKVKDIVAASQTSSQTEKGVTSGADANATTDALAKLQTAMKWTRRSRGRDTDMQMLDDDEGSVD
jgi:hypothetical protein